jgi:hypothetical protein
MVVKSLKTNESGTEGLLQPSASSTRRLLVLLTKALQPAKSVNVILYLHGHYVGGATSFQEFRAHYTSSEMVKGVFEANKPLVLALPELGENADSGDWVSSSTKNFDSVIKDTLDIAAKQAKVKKLELGTLVLAAHSGGGFVMRRIRDLGSTHLRNLKEVWMLDSLYDDAKRWVSWASLHSGVIVHDIYTKGAKETHAPYLNSSKIYEPARRGEPMLIKDPPPKAPPVNNLQPAVESAVNHHKVPGAYTCELIRKSKNL